jgi:hypothetical protein
MRITLIGCLLVAAAASPAMSAERAETVTNELASAGENSSAVSETAAKPAPEADKKICKRLEASYSYASDRVCLTKDEWKKVEEQAR